jgi:succinate dehydrogenase / fumarate reductase cytochrome b subunit
LNQSGDNVNNKRPVNLAISTIKFPPMAIISILHRLSGLLLFLAIPFLLCALSTSLGSEDGFEKIKVCLSAPWPKAIIWLVLSALMYHLMAGIRHLLMDLGFGEDVKAGRITALFVMLLAVLVAVLLGVWLW